MLCALGVDFFYYWSHRANHGNDNIDLISARVTFLSWFVNDRGEYFVVAASSASQFGGV